MENVLPSLACTYEIWVRKSGGGKKEAVVLGPPCLGTDRDRLDRDGYVSKKRCRFMPGISEHQARSRAYAYADKVNGVKTKSGFSLAWISWLWTWIPGLG